LDFCILTSYINTLKSIKNIALIFVAALFMAACNRSDSIEFSGDLEVGEVVEGMLEMESPDTFYFEFGAGTYIYGVCMQLTVDVQVALYDSAGTSLGMNSSLVRANPSVIIPGASQGYVFDSAGYHEAGGIYTTVEDFSKWMGNFSKPLLGGIELVNRLVTVDTLNNGDTMSYALGIGVDEFRGLKSYNHGGADIAHRPF
jgi:hypothetical protein